MPRNQWPVSVGIRTPDISTAETLKQTLLKAQSIASIPASATGAQFSREPEAAKAFIAYLMSPSAIAVIKAKGMNPG